MRGAVSELNAHKLSCCTVSLLSDTYFLGLRLDLLLRIVRVQSQRVLLEVARDTIRLESPICAAADWLLECGHRQDFDGADCKDDTLARMSRVVSAGIAK